MRWLQLFGFPSVFWMSHRTGTVLNNKVLSQLLLLSFVIQDGGSVEQTSLNCAAHVLAKAILDFFSYFGSKLLTLVI